MVHATDTQRAVESAIPVVGRCSAAACLLASRALGCGETGTSKNYRLVKHRDDSNHVVMVVPDGSRVACLSAL